MTSNYGPLFWRKVAADFARTFLAVFLPGLFGVYTELVQTADGTSTIDIDRGWSALIALTVAAASATLRALQARFTTIETPREDLRETEHY